MSSGDGINYTRVSTELKEESIISGEVECLNFKNDDEKSNDLEEVPRN